MSSAPEVVLQKSVTFVNYSTPAEITTKELDLATCYKDNEIVIKVEAASLNPIDLLLHGMYPKHLLPQKPKPYGMDFAGTIVKRGAKVDAAKWAVGRKVNGMLFHMYGDRGTLSNYLVIDPVAVGSVTPMSALPESLVEYYGDKRYNEFEVNAAWPLVFGTAFGALFRQGQHLGPESKVLVLGASTSVASCFIQIAKNYSHIGTVVGTCNSRSVEFNKAKGFDYLVTYDEGDTVEKVKELIANELNGERFDLIFDTVGNKQFFPVINEVLKPMSANSQYVTIAGDAKLSYSNPTYSSMMPSKQSLLSFTPWKKLNYTHLLVDSKSDWMELGAKMLKEGSFKPLIDSVYLFDDFQHAIDRLMSNKCRGKVVIDVNTSSE